MVCKWTLPVFHHQHLLPYPSCASIWCVFMQNIEKVIHLYDLQCKIELTTVHWKDTCLSFVNIPSEYLAALNICYLLLVDLGETRTI
jgi:hypothetical protein